MKKLIAILPLVFGLMLSAQELPEANKKVLEYAKSKMGQKVGKGICFNLVDSALCQVNPGWKNSGDGYNYGKRINIKKIMPGDILLEPNHVAIVYKVNDDGSIVVLNQNVVNSPKYKLKDSKVVFLTYDEDKESTRYLKFYRPR